MSRFSGLLPSRAAVKLAVGEDLRHAPRDAYDFATYVLNRAREIEARTAGERQETTLVRKGR